MKFGVRECCDVVLRAKGTQKVGNKIFYKNEPVCYFDTLKTSSLEGAATTVYAQGGRGNARLMSWDGERTVTWTMEDALISPVGMMILTGAGLIESSEETPIYVHTTEQLQLDDNNFNAGVITLAYDPHDAETNKLDGDYIYIMRLDSNGDIATEPFIGTRVGEKQVQVKDRERKDESGDVWNYHGLGTDKNSRYVYPLAKGDVILVDYYRAETAAGAAQEIQITPDKFGGSYYLEASTLFRNEDGIDMPAEFIIPNCRIQSNFTFTMASSGDPSSFTFTIDAFPDYTRFDRTKKVLAAIQVLTAGVGAGNELMRLETNHHKGYIYEDNDGIVRDKRYEKGNKASGAAENVANTAEGYFADSAATSTHFANAPAINPEGYDVEAETGEPIVANG